jgi:putative peptidoglycan lipid II flippase
MGYGQVIATLPISLFSMSVSAAELPALSSATGTPAEVADYLRLRLTTGLRRIAFFIVPSAVAFLLLGDVLAGALYQSGRFKHTDAVYVWAILAGSAVGLLAGSLGRLYSSAFYALLDTRTPLRFAIVRVTLTIGLGLLFALPLPRWLGIDQRWGAAGLTASAGIAGWIEFVLLRQALAKRIGSTALGSGFTARLWIVAFAGGGMSYAAKLALGATSATHPILLACLVLPLYGAVYFGGTAFAGITESRATLGKFTRRLGITAW